MRVAWERLRSQLLGVVLRRMRFILVIPMLLFSWMSHLIHSPSGSGPRSSANIGFARPIAHGFEAVVYERGDGITQACGSGACAIGATAVNKQMYQANVPIEVHLPGGVLRVTVQSSGEVELEGEAIRVFRGEVPLP